MTYAFVITGTSITAQQIDWVERGTGFWDMPADTWSATALCWSTGTDDTDLRQP